MNFVTGVLKDEKSVLKAYLGSPVILSVFNGISLVKIPIYCMCQVPGRILTA